MYVVQASAIEHIRAGVSEPLANDRLNKQYIKYIIYSWMAACWP